MSKALARFLEEPTGPHFVSAWRSVTKSGRRVDFVALKALLAHGQAGEVREHLDSLPQWLRLSPRVQELAALAAEMAADAEEAELARFLFATCLEGILAAGDGSVEHPYVAVQPADEQPILAILGREAASQALVENRGRMLDVVLCRDGGEVCFDVTHSVRPARLRPKKVLSRVRRKAAVR
jgi:hypothetical protein